MVVSLDCSYPLGPPRDILRLALRYLSLATRMRCLTVRSTVRVGVGRSRTRRISDLELDCYRMKAAINSDGHAWSERSRRLFRLGRVVRSGRWLRPVVVGRALVIFSLCSCLWTAAPLAADDGTAEALRLSVEGRRAFSRRDYENAAGLFDQAFAQQPAPTIAVWSARAWLAAGRSVEAAGRYRAALRASSDVGERAAQLRAQVDAGKQLAALLPRIPTVLVLPRAPLPSSALVELDGAPLARTQLRVPLRLNPGQHRVEVRAGDSSRRYSFVLAEGDAKTLVVDGLPRPEPTTSVARVVGYSAVALGAVSLAAAITTTIVALNTCDGGLFAGRAVCTDDDVRNTHDGLRTAASVTTYAGLSLTTVGLVLILTDSSMSSVLDAGSEPRQRTSLRVGLGHVLVRGSF